MKTVLHLVFAAFLVISLSSKKDGFGFRFQQGSTGAPGESGLSCGRASCHTGGNFDPKVTIHVKDADGNDIDKYIPNTTYNVSLEFTTDGDPGGYGFQMVALDDATNEDVGLWSNLSSDMQLVEIMGRQYIEHNTRIASQPLSFEWTSPDKNTADVQFYVAGLAVNGDNNKGNDGATQSTLKLTENIESSLSDHSDITQLSIYPNPTQEFITIKSAMDTRYTILNQNGQKVKEVSTGTIDVSDLNTGLYIISPVIPTMGSQGYKFVKH